MCSSTPEVGQEGQKFKDPLDYFGDLRLFCNKRKSVSENQNSRVTMTSTATITDDVVR